MEARLTPRSAGRARLMLASTVVCLVVTVVAGYLTRLQLRAASAWVAHTDEVKLAIDDCELALLRGDLTALHAGRAKVRSLTADNARQQENIARVEALGDGAPQTVQAVLTSMLVEEDRLMVLRLDIIDTARARSACAFVVAGVLTVLFAAGAFVTLQAQHRSLLAAEQASRRERALLDAVIESVDEGVIAVEPSRKILAMNAVARAMVGAAYPRDQLPTDWRAAIESTLEDGTPLLPENAPLARAIRGEITEGLVYRIVPTGPDARGTWVSTTARPIRDAEGRLVAAVATLRDITEQRADAERLRDLSLTDELTGLLNRRGFMGAAQARIAVARLTKASIGLLYADVNGLKQINDELGHDQGDRVIADAAGVLRKVFRDGDVVARIGGDEFVALLPNMAVAASEGLLARLASAVRAHGERETRPYRLSLSAGLTFMDWSTGQTLEGLLVGADERMYERKKARASGGDSMAAAPCAPLVPDVKVSKI